MATPVTTVQITMPQVGESVTEGTVLEWLKQEGDRVEAGEALVEVSTDKVDTEIPAPSSGTLTKILVQPDSTVNVGDPLGEIETGDAPERPAGDDAEPQGDDAEPQGELVDVTFPQMGDSVSEGTVLEWRKSAGDTVAAEEPLVEISTDKVDAEVPAPVAGRIAEILVEPDEPVPVGTVLCRIEAGAGEPAGAQQPAADPEEVRRDAAPQRPGNGELNATPVALRIASAHGIDVE